MFAVIKTGGKQYRVAANDVITIATVQGGPGDPVVFDEVLLVGGEAGHEIGTPTVSGASVAGELVAHVRGEKVIAFKKRRRQNSRRKRGHRQDLSRVRITEVLTGGAVPSRRTAQAASQEAPAAPVPGDALTALPADAAATI